MKKTITLSFAIFSILNLSLAQEKAITVIDEKIANNTTHKNYIYIENGLNYSNLTFNNSSGLSTFTNSQETGQAKKSFGIGLNVPGTYSWASALDVLIGGTYSKNKVIGSYLHINDYQATYELEYLTIDFGILYTSPEIKDNISAQILVSGNSSTLVSAYRDNIIDISNHEDFKGKKIGYCLGIGVNYKTSEFTDVYFRSEVRNDLKINSSQVGQSTEMSLICFSVGLNLRIKKNN